MSDPVDSLLVDVRANTQAFARDMAQMRSSLDGTLVDGFARAGTVLESGLQSALRKGGEGFLDLRRIALDVLGTIAAEAARALLGGGASGGSGAGGGGGDLAGFGAAAASALGLPGRATGGPVAPGRGYLVGETGPELFVPTSAGRIETARDLGPGAGPREVRVAITVQAPPGTGPAQALQLSSRQVASAVRRALREA